MAEISMTFFTLNSGHKRLVVFYVRLLYFHSSKPFLNIFWIIIHSRLANCQPSPNNLPKSNSKTSNCKFPTFEFSYLKWLFAIWSLSIYAILLIKWLKLIKVIKNHFKIENYLLDEWHAHLWWFYCYLSFLHLFFIFVCLFVIFHFCIYFFIFVCLFVILHFCIYFLSLFACL
jgi:hypothetical protein